jgi:hypothetical protein
MTQHFIRAACLASCIVLAACVTPSPAPTATPVPAKTVAKVQPPSASILIVGRSNKALIEDIVLYRTGKGMKLLSRGPTRLEFSSNIAKANIPTEARIQYTLTQASQGWQLGAKVLQISFPGTKNEKVEDITAHVLDKLNEELARYATN